jgi:hypothetical protein
MHVSKISISKLDLKPEDMIFSYVGNKIDTKINNLTIKLGF